MREVVLEGEPIQQPTRRAERVFLAREYLVGLGLSWDVQHFCVVLRLGVSSALRGRTGSAYIVTVRNCVRRIGIVRMAILVAWKSRGCGYFIDPRMFLSSDAVAGQSVPCS